MPDAPMPPSPHEQLQLRECLEKTLKGWKVAYRHHDSNWTSEDGRQAVCGWGTHIDRGSGRPELHVWFDELDRDIAIYGTRSEYIEWRNLESMPAVLEELTSALSTHLASDR